MWSGYDHVVAAAAVLSVRGRVSRLLVGLFGVGFLALQRALAQSDLLRLGALLVLVSVGASCVGPAWYVFTVCRPPSVGEKGNGGGSTAVKNFKTRCHFPCPALAALHAQPIIWYFTVLFGRPFSFACAIHMYTPRRRQGPVGPPWCVPVLPMGAPPSDPFCTPLSVAVEQRLNPAEQHVAVQPPS